MKHVEATDQTAHQQRSGIALATLVAAGLLLGVTTNLAKLASEHALLPLPYLTWSLFGATVILVGYAVARGRMATINSRTLEYFVVAGFLTTAGANLIFFHAVPHLGVSFIAMMIALPPLLTYVGALALGMEQFVWQRAGGVLLALLGTALLVAKQWQTPTAQPFWILLALLGPVLLAAGNLYRTRRWPPGSSADSLAPGMLIAGTSILALYSLVSGQALTIDIEDGDNMLLILCQSIIFAAQFLLMFVLQKTGGPVLLSLMGCVSTALAVPIAMWLFDESLLPGFGISVLLLIAGIASLFFSQGTCSNNSSQV